MNQGTEGSDSRFPDFSKAARCLQLLAVVRVLNTCLTKRGGHFHHPATAKQDKQVLRKCSASAQQVQEWREFSIKVAKGEIQTAAPSALGFRREWTRQSNCQVVMRMTGCRDLSEESNGQIVYEAI